MRLCVVVRLLFCFLYLLRERELISLWRHGIRTVSTVSQLLHLLRITTRLHAAYQRRVLFVLLLLSHLGMMCTINGYARLNVVDNRMMYMRGYIKLYL